MRFTTARPEVIGITFATNPEGAAMMLKMEGLAAVNVTPSVICGLNLANANK